MAALRRGWRDKGGDQFAGLFDKRLDDHLPSDLLTWVRKVAQEGVDAQYRGTQRARVQATPHPSLKDHVEEARQLIWTDAARGRVLLMSPERGEEALLDGVVSVPLARVPKYNPDRSVSEKGRVIWDARVVNELCSKEDHFPAGLTFLVSSPRPVTVLYLAMTFGWTGAPGEFMAYAWAMKLLHRACCPDRAEWHDSSAFRSLALMDDSVVIEPDLGLRPQISMDALESAIRQTLGPLAMNADKDVEEGALTTRKLIWGLEFDTR